MDGGIFATTLSQMGYLFLLVAAGFVLAKAKVTDGKAVKTLSVLETWLFIPALFLATFMKEFTVEKLSSAGMILLVSLAVELVVIFLSFFLVRLLAKDTYLRKIHQYAIAFANFGYFGNAILSALYPDLFADYLLYTLVLWMAIAVWGAPMLMKEKTEEEKPWWKTVLKHLLNPMFFAMLIGMALGLSGLKLPAFLTTAVDATAACMSPVAMLLSGMIFAAIPLKKALRHGVVYVMTVLRLLVIPLVFLSIGRLCRIPDAYVFLGTAAMAMPVGLNVMVLPAAYGDVPEEASGMVLVSHVLSALTIPFLFWLMTVWK